MFYRTSECPLMHKKNKHKKVKRKEYNAIGIKPTADQSSSKKLTITTKWEDKDTPHWFFHKSKTW